jgi:hypothetical protein
MFYMKNTAVFGIFSNRLQVEEAINQLRLDGFRQADISVLYPDNSGTKDFAHEKSTKAPEGAAAGIGIGAIAGGALGWLAGVGAFSVPELAPFAAAGPIVGAMAGAGAMGTIAGVAGALVGLSEPEYEARRYQGRIKDGGMLLSVHCDNEDWVKRAKAILKISGGHDIAGTAEAKADFGASDRPAPRSHNISRMAG